MKKIIFPFLAISLFLIVLPVWAKNENLNAGSGGSGIKSASSTVSISITGAQIKNENKVQTQNKGEENEVQIQIQEREEFEAGESGAVSPGEKKSSAPRNETALDHMSVVSKKVEEILTSRTKGGIGEQVREIARAQNQIQERTRESLNKVSARKGLTKIILGPDYKALNILNNQIKENETQILALEEVMTQATNNEDINLIKSTIEALVQQNATLREQIKEEEKVKSLLGWAIKLFIK